jgi:hypothetical protein
MILENAEESRSYCSRRSVGQSTRSAQRAREQTAGLIELPPRLRIAVADRGWSDVATIRATPSGTNLRRSAKCRLHVRTLEPWGLCCTRSHRARWIRSRQGQRHPSTVCAPDVDGIGFPGRVQRREARLARDPRDHHCCPDSGRDPWSQSKRVCWSHVTCRPGSLAALMVPATLVGLPCR